MESNDRATGDREDGAARPRSHLFAVRLWKAEVAGTVEYRGSVRDVVSGAFHNFRDWSELAGFMIGRISEDETAQAR